MKVTRSVSFGLFVSSLLLVGAGCGTAIDQNAQIDTSSYGTDANNAVGLNIDGEAGTEANVPAKVEADADAKIVVPDTVDGSIEAILKDSDDEKGMQSDMESDADDFADDGAEINAFGQSSYDIESN